MAKSVGAESGEPVDEAWEVPGIIGAALAAHAAPAQRVLQNLRVTRTLSHQDVHALSTAADHIMRIAVVSQQMTRLACGRLRQSHERIDVAEVLRQLLVGNDYRYHLRGLLFETQLRATEVIMDPGLLVSLCETVIECAAAHGGRLQVWLTMLNWPEHGLLTVRTRPHVRQDLPHGQPRQQEESVDWIYLQRLADATGVKLTREVHHDYVEFAIQFPRTVRSVQGLTAMEVEGDPVSVDSRPFAGHRVLLVCNQQNLVWEVQATCRNMRLVLDVVPDCDEAVRYCERDMPDAIIVHEWARTPLFDELRQDILDQNITFPCVEIVEKDHVVELGPWAASGISRISRSELRNELQAVLTMELAKVF